MDLRAAMTIANKNIGVSILGIGYAVVLFYIIFFGVLGFGVIMYGYYGVYLDISFLAILAILLFFPGYIYAHMNLFSNIITRQPKSFNAMTDIMIIGSLKSLPITIIKLFLTLILSIPSIILIAFFNLDLPILLAIVFNLLFASIISEYIFSYSYYFHITQGVNMLKSIRTGVTISIKTLLLNLPIFFIYYLILLIQLLPVVNLMLLLWLPIAHVYVVGNFRKNASAGI